MKLSRTKAVLLFTGLIVVFGFLAVMFAGTMESEPTQADLLSDEMKEIVQNFKFAKEDAKMKKALYEQAMREEDYWRNQREESLQKQTDFINASLEITTKPPEKVVYADSIIYPHESEPIIEQESEKVNTKEYIGEWKVSTYYTPVKGQDKYFNGSYDSDFYINCSGDCFVTASGYTLTEKDVKKIVACPSPFKFGTIFDIEGVGEVRCEDRGGAIKGKRLDLWVGSGNSGYSRIGQGSGNKLKIYKINQ